MRTSEWFTGGGSISDVVVSSVTSVLFISMELSAGRCLANFQTVNASMALSLKALRLVSER